MGVILNIAAKVRLKAIVAIICINLSIPAFAQIPLDESANFLSGLEVRELLEEMTTLPTLNATIRISPRWETPINFFINLPHDPQLANLLIEQIQRLSSAVPGLPPLNIGKSTPKNQANFIIDSVKDAGQQTHAQSEDLALLPRVDCTAKVQRSNRAYEKVFILVRQSLPRTVALQCILNSVLGQMGVHDPKEYRDLFSDSLVNNANEMLVSFNDIDFTLLQYVYMNKDVKNFRTLTKVMSGKVYKNRQQLRPLVEEFYRNPAKREQFFSEIVRLIGRREALVYLALTIYDRANDPWQSQYLDSVDKDDISFLKQHCRSCFFAFVFYKMSSVDIAKISPDMASVFRQAKELYTSVDGPLIQSRLLYYSSLIDFLNKDTGQNLNEVCNLIMKYEGERSSSFILAKFVLGSWSASQKQRFKTASIFRELRSLYDGTIIPASKEAELLMSAASSLGNIGLKSEALQNARDARTRYELLGDLEALKKLDFLERKLQ